jgi:hypothetical protein
VDAAFVVDVSSWLGHSFLSALPEQGQSKKQNAHSINCTKLTAHWASAIGVTAALLDWALGKDGRTPCRPRCALPVRLRARIMQRTDRSQCWRCCLE